MMVYVVYGVSGVGKTTIGKALANELSVPFYDADDFHPSDNIAKMASGLPLNDEDRMPWLLELSKQMLTWSKSGGAVLACSALKQDYRRLLKGKNTEVVFLCLNAKKEVVADRLNQRTGHFMKTSLLASQYEILEISPDDICVDVNNSVEYIVKDILEKMKQKSEIGLIGLGVMGSSLAQNIANNNIAISVYNRHVPNTEVDVAKNFVLQHQELRMEGFDNIELFVESLSKPRSILLMVNAGEAVDLVIAELLPLLEENDLIIDGGNSHYVDSKRRAEFLRESNILFLGMGVSGGEEGALKGPSIMPGGSQRGYERIAPILDVIAAKDKKDLPCCSFIGPEGAGHFVKMVHNGIEYAEMQLIAELYHLLRFHCEKTPTDIAQLFEEWSDTDLNSYLLSITIDILRTEEHGQSIVDVILDKAGQKGTGGWSTNAALLLGKPLDSISQAVMARCLSAMKDQRVEASALYGDSRKSIIQLNEHDIKTAYQSARIINHAIGFDLMQEASKEYSWGLNLSEIARVWTNGCIIRSTLMEKLVSLFRGKKRHLLFHPDIVLELQESQVSLAKVTSMALQAGCAVPVLSASLNYFLGFISAQSSANIIQAQRDFFGAHTFQRVDRPKDEYFHFDWSK